jgi:hypothetical protein
MTLAKLLDCHLKFFELLKVIIEIVCCFFEKSMSILKISKGGEYQIVTQNLLNVSFFEVDHIVICFSAFHGLFAFLFGLFTVLSSIFSNLVILIFIDDTVLKILDELFDLCHVFFDGISGLLSHLSLISDLLDISFSLVSNT